MNEAKPPGIKIGQIFLEQASFSHREDHLAFPPATPPNVGDVTIDTQSGLTRDEQHGLVRVRVRTKAENEPLYEFDIRMVALFDVVENAPNLPMSQYVTLHGPASLYPFVRQVVADVTGRGRFGPVWLSPVNLAAVAASRTKRSATKKLKKKAKSKQAKETKAKRTKKVKRTTKS